MTETRPVPRLLLVEDDADTASLIRETLSDHFGVDPLVHASTVAEALAKDVDAFDLVLSDLKLPDGSGLELLDRLLAARSDLPVVIVTAESDLEAATTAIGRGAYDFIVKAGGYLMTIPLMVEKNLAVWQIKSRNHELKQKLEQTLEELRVKNRQLEQQALTDPLTGLANRRHIEAMLEQNFAEARRYHADLACLMIDLDGFKQFNDTVGHQRGDQLLQTVAEVLQETCRRSDVAGRYGGDEFVVLLPQTGPATAELAARRIKQRFATKAHRRFSAARAAAGCQCDLSIGIACVSSSRPVNADQLVALADDALYRAKAAGKSRIHVHRTSSQSKGTEAASAETGAPPSVPIPPPGR